MTPRHTDFQQRKDMVLGIVVNSYIKTIFPVSSAYIKQEYFLNLSPATIRNILASLEQEGFLTHPHTSAGRIPTEEGYRYYVDHLMDEIQLLEAEKERVKREYAQEVKDLEEALEKASQVISDITQYTSIISIDGLWDRYFCKGTRYVVEYPEHPDLNEIRDILSTLEQKDRILKIINQKLEDKIRIYIGHEMECSDIESCSLAVSQYQVYNGPSGRIAVLGPKRMDYRKVVSTLEYMSSLIEEILS